MSSAWAFGRYETAVRTALPVAMTNQKAALAAQEKVVTQADHSLLVKKSQSLIATYFPVKGHMSVMSFKPCSHFSFCPSGGDHMYLNPEVTI